MRGELFTRPVESVEYIIQCWELLPTWDTMEYPCQSFPNAIFTMNKCGMVSECEEECVGVFMTALMYLRAVLLVHVFKQAVWLEGKKNMLQLNVWVV